jgi:hypothetical protein
MCFRSRALNKLMGFKVFVSDFCVTIPWVLPAEPFFEWEPKDEWFCRKYGIGRPGRPVPSCFRFENSFIMHPDIYAKMRDVLPEPSPMSDSYEHLLTAAMPRNIVDGF